MIFKKKIYLLVIPIISLVGGLWQNQYIYDGYHWGFIFTNALELIEGKIPYKEIFLEYGILSVIINSITLIITNENIYSLMIVTSIFYSLSLYLIGELTYKITLNKLYSFFAILIIFLLYPWPTTPWPNFYSFFFTILFCVLYLKKKRIYYIISGISLGFAYLSLSTIYNYIIIIFYSLVFLLFFLFKKKLNKIDFQKIYYSFISFVITLLVFILYLKINNILSIWWSYQKLPFLFSSTFNKGTIIDLLFNYINFLTIYSIKNIILEPQWIIYSIFFYSNIIVLVVSLLNLFRQKKKKFNNEIIIISLIILSLNVYAQVLGIEKLATSLSLGVISLMLIINSLKLSENRTILIFSIFFITLYSLIFSYSLESSKIGGLRSAHLKDLINLKNKYNKDDIKYFKNQKWNKTDWDFLSKIIDIQDNLSKKCNIKYGVNLTSNTYIHVLLNYEKKQIIPFFINSNENSLRNFIEPNLIQNIQKEIDKNNILIISAENNHLLFNLTNYEKPIILEITNPTKEINKKYLYIYYPTKCI